MSVARRASLVCISEPNFAPNAAHRAFSITTCVTVLCLRSLQRQSPSPPPSAVLRLDTDWYNSTRYELDVLLPRLAPGGVLIFDDLFETFAGRVDPRRPSACCSGLAATEYFPASLIARGVDMAKQLAFEGPSGHGGLRAPLQWHLVRSHLANNVVDRATGQRGPMTHDRYWATLNQTVQSWNSRGSL